MSPFEYKHREVFKMWEKIKRWMLKISLDQLEEILNKMTGVVFREYRLSYSAGKSFTPEVHRILDDYTEYIAQRIPKDVVDEMRRTL